MTSLAKRLVEAGAHAMFTADTKLSWADNARVGLLASLHALQDAGPSEGMIRNVSGNPAIYLIAKASWNAMLSTLISEIEATDA